MALSDRRREHPRVRPATGERVEVHIMGEGFLDVLPARDISVGGVAIRVPHDFQGCDIDLPVDLIIKVVGEKPFSARGIIRHLSKQAGGHFFGVEFTSIAEEHVDVIRRYVDRKVTQSQGK